MTLGELLDRLYQVNEAPNLAAKPALAEKILKELIAAHPDSAERYFDLGQFYQGRRQLKEAIEAFNQCLDHTNTGGGLEAHKNEIMQVLSYNAIAWIYMDLAENEGVDSDPGRSDLNESRKYAVKLQNAHGVPGMSFLLSGRMHYLQGKMPEAATDLRSAEANLSNSPGQDDRLLQTWLLLAQTNLRQQQPGGRLDYYDKALKMSSGSSYVILQRSAVVEPVGQVFRCADRDGGSAEIFRFVVHGNHPTGQAHIGGRQGGAGQGGRVQ